MRSLLSSRQQRAGFLAVIALAACFATQVGADDRPIRVAAIGSKRFTESYVLGEIAKAQLARAGLSAEHRQGMGGTIILWQALRGGGITAYPEYTGTIGEEILKLPASTPVGEMRAALAREGVGMTGELGFNNTYALVMRRAEAARLGIAKISDLRAHPDLRVGLTHEFLQRRDGWAPLGSRYRLAMRDVRGLDHALAYAALADGGLDVTDAYSTDAKIAENDWLALADDLGFFPPYQAVFLYRLDTDPRVVAALRGLEGRLDAGRMTALNADAERAKDYAAAAAGFFAESGGALTSPRVGKIAAITAKIARLTRRHLALVGESLLLAIVVGLPLGIAASRPGWGSGAILGVVGVIQTIPSLALLALLVPFLGINATTAVAALFLYSLLPIVRNTATGLRDIPPALRESARALGLEPAARLRKVYLPMASRAILAGIQTSAVINVGTATLAALIGAGGLGEPILSGLNLNDTATILQGALPAAGLAVATQGVFAGLDRWLIPRGLQTRGAGEAAGR